MLCRNPFMAGTVPFGCGQCLPCRINRSRQWMWRQFLESLCHEENCFITLTYDRAHIPGNWQLEPDVVRLWLYRFRKAVRPLRVRFFLCGEYGEESFRPHYHLSLFGVSGLTVVGNNTVSSIVERTWGRGFVHVAEFNHLTAQYISGYVIKKLKDRKDGRCWNVPEFARMSNRPGIGASAMRVISRSLIDNAQDWKSGDVPHNLRVGKRLIPIGRYLLNKLREECGFTEEYIKEVRDSLSMEKSLDMQALRLNSPGAISFKASYLDDIEGKLASVEARANIWKKRRSV